MSELNTAALAAKNDPAHFEALVKLLDNKLKSQAHHIAKSLRHSDEDDVYQHLLIGLNEIVKIFDPNKVFLGLVNMKIRYIAYRLYKKENTLGRRAFEYSLDDKGDYDEFPSFAEKLIAPTVESQDFVEDRCRKMLSKVLSGEQLEWAFLHYCHGYSSGEIAAMAGVSLRKAYNTLHKARKALRESLDKDTGELLK